jgi:hypothetical protein
MKGELAQWRPRESRPALGSAFVVMQLVGEKMAGESPPTQPASVKRARKKMK